MLVFLKLGGSLITEKDKPLTPRLHVIKQAAAEIKSALQANPDLTLILGHGSGSFGHVPAKTFNTIHGVYTSAQWAGFAEVWKAAHDLNQIVASCLADAGIPIISFPPSAQVLARNRKIVQWNIAGIKKSLGSLVPLVFGDVVFDKKINGTILSTEDLFAYLANNLHPDRILLAGIEEGIYSDFPTNSKIIKGLSLPGYKALTHSFQDSIFPDVTGGMRSKVEIMMRLLARREVKSVSIFNGLKKDAILESLTGSYPGTTMTRPKRIA